MATQRTCRSRAWLQGLPESPKRPQGIDEPVPGCPGKYKPLGPGMPRTLCQSQESFANLVDMVFQLCLNGGPSLGCNFMLASVERIQQDAPKLFFRPSLLILPNQAADVFARRREALGATPMTHSRIDSGSEIFMLAIAFASIFRSYGRRWQKLPFSRSTGEARIEECPRAGNTPAPSACRSGRLHRKHSCLRCPRRREPSALCHPGNRARHGRTNR